MRMTPAALGALLKGDMHNFEVASTPGGIEAQEADGQRNLCNSSKIPKQIDGKETRADFEVMGIIFKDDADDLFVNVELLSSWKLQATDHSMWSKLVDAEGKVRAEIFYKAAFYDERASMRIIQEEKKENE